MSHQFVPQPTADGSFTFFSEEFQESYHSNFGARQESFQKFVVPTLLTDKTKQPVVRILDVCYGLGYNTAAAIQAIWSINPNCYVEIIGLELNPEVPKAALNHNLFQNWDYKYIDILAKLSEQHCVKTENIKANLLCGDARITIQEVLQSSFLADAIFLDPFSPPQCPQLWTVDFIHLVAKCLHLEGRLATYSCAASVRTALITTGLVIGSTPPIGRKTPGTIAAHSHVSIPPISQAEQEHLQTRAAVPYRDPCLSDSAQVIQERRHKEQLASPLEPTSRWRKRWAKRI